jgi:amidase
VSEHDSVGALVPHGRFHVEPVARGPLSGLTFVAKDLYDVAGHPTGAGNPTWLATHPLPTQNAALVERCLAAGATLMGKVITDELAYSLNGDNMHYGTPLNVNAPDRVPGGSSSGSAAAAAAGLCDFALGTDTGGSIRVPASFCGVWGIRPTHGLLPGDGVVPLSPSFDTFGWLAHDGETFERVGAALLPPVTLAFDRVLIFEDVWALADVELQPVLESVARVLERLLAVPRRVVAGDPDLETWRASYVTLSAYEAWRAHGAWIESAKPTLASAIAQRFAFAKKVSKQAGADAAALRESVAARMTGLLGSTGVAILPTTPGYAPLLNAPPAAVDSFRARTLRMTSIAGMARLPQVNIPFRGATGLPLGVSLLGPGGSDRALIALARAVRC